MLRTIATILLAAGLGIGGALALTLTHDGRRAPVAEVIAPIQAKPTPVQATAVPLIKPNPSLFSPAQTAAQSTAQSGPAQPPRLSISSQSPDRPAAMAASISAGLPPVFAPATALQTPLGSIVPQVNLPAQHPAPQATRPATIEFNPWSTGVYR